MKMNPIVQTYNNNLEHLVENGRSQVNLIELPRSIELLVKLTQVLRQDLSHNSTASTEVRWQFIFMTGVAASISAAIYFFAAQPAGQEYSNRIDAPEAGWIFTWLAPISTALTNVLFNWEAFFSLWSGYDSLLVYSYAAFQALYINPFKEIAALCASAGSILPFWFVALGNNIGLNILITFSSIVSLFVYYNGADIFYQTTAYSETQLFLLRISYFFSRLTCRDVSNIESKINVAKKKKILMAHLNECYQHFYYFEYEQRQAYLSLYSSATEPTDQLRILLCQKNESLYTDLVNQSFLWQFIKYGILGLLGMMQNFGGIVISWEAGASTHIVLAAFLALCALVPSIGFSIKGILGYGLLELFHELTSTHVSHLQRLWPKLYLSLVWPARFFYLLSGFGNDALNQEAAVYCGFNTNTVRVIGILANIATALVFNGPQIECLLRRLLEIITLNFGEERDKCQIRCQIQFRNTIEEFAMLPLREVERCLSDSPYSMIFSSFFHEKNTELCVNKENITTLLLER